MWKSLSGNGRALLTLLASLGCAVAVVAAIGIEWRTAPDWCSPRKLLGRDAIYWNPWYRLFLAEALQIALLVWIKKGRLLLGWTALKVVLFVGLTLLRPQNILAYAVLLGLSLVAGCLGRRLLVLLCPRLPAPGFERTLLAVILGYGILGFLGLILSLTSALHVGIVAGVLGVLALLVSIDCKHLVVEAFTAGRRAWAERPDDLLAAVVVALCAACLMPTLMVALSDDTEYDVVMYHLGVPQVYVLAGQQVAMPECPHTHFCHGVEMLYTLGLVTAGQPLPQLMHCLAGILIAALLFCLGRRVAGPTCGWLACVCFYALPLVSVESGHAMSDLFVTLYLFAAIHAAVLWFDSEYAPLAALAGCFAGLAVGAKLNALLFVVPLLAAMMGRLCWAGPFKRQAVRGMLACGTATLAMTAPWLIVEWCQTGNPVFPFFNAVFKSPLMEPVNEKLDLSLYGVGRGVGSFLLLPWHLAVCPEKFGDHGWGALEGLTLVSLPLTVLLWDRRLWRLLWLPGSVLLAGCLLWFMGGQVVRYLLPLAPVLALLAAINVTILWSVFGTSAPRRAAMGAVALLGVLCWFQGASWWSMKQTAPEGYPWRVAMGFESTEDHLRRIMPEYDPLCYLARLADSKATRVLSYPRHLRLYGGKGTYYGRAFSGGDQRSLQADKEKLPIRDAPEAARALTAMSMDYLLITYDHEFQVDPMYASAITDPAFLDQHCRLIMTREGFYHRRVCLYQFQPESVAPSSSYAPSPGVEQGP